MQTCFFCIFLKFPFFPLLLLILFPHFTLTNTVHFLWTSTRGTALPNFSLKPRDWCRNPNHNFRITGGDLHIHWSWKLWLPLIVCFWLTIFFVINQEAHRRKPTIHNCFSAKLRASWLLQTWTESKCAWTWSCNYCCFVQIHSYESSDLWSSWISRSNVFFNSAITYITYLFAYAFSCPHFMKI